MMLYKFLYYYYYYYINFSLSRCRVISDRMRNKILRSANAKYHFGLTFFFYKINKGVTLVFNLRSGVIFFVLFFFFLLLCFFGSRGKKIAPDTFI